MKEDLMPRSPVSIILLINLIILLFSANLTEFYLFIYLNILINNNFIVNQP